MLTRPNCAKLLADSGERGRANYLPPSLCKAASDVCIHPPRWWEEERCVLRSHSWILEKLDIRITPMDVQISKKKPDRTSLLRTKKSIVRDANYVAVFDYQPT